VSMYKYLLFICKVLSLFDMDGCGASWCVECCRRRGTMVIDNHACCRTLRVMPVRSGSFRVQLALICGIEPNSSSWLLPQNASTASLGSPEYSLSAATTR
jgi:hypothetical protein